MRRYLRCDGAEQHRAQRPSAAGPGGDEVNAELDRGLGDDVRRAPALNVQLDANASFGERRC